MNEKIKSFMSQAGTDTSGKWMSVDNAEKFAELIVQECMRMCEVAEVSLLTHGVREQSYGAADAKRYISDWFGVEL
jgi:hypothetical protein